MPEYVNHDCECGKSLMLSADLSGTSVRCPECQRSFTVPNSPDAEENSHGAGQRAEILQGPKAKADINGVATDLEDPRLRATGKDNSSGNSLRPWMLCIGFLLTAGVGILLFLYGSGAESPGSGSSPHDQSSTVPVGPPPSEATTAGPRSEMEVTRSTNIADTRSQEPYADGVEQDYATANMSLASDLDEIFRGVGDVQAGTGPDSEAEIAGSVASQVDEQKVLLDRQRDEALAWAKYVNLSGSFYLSAEDADKMERLMSRSVFWTTLKLPGIESDIFEIEQVQWRMGLNTLEGLVATRVSAPATLEPFFSLLESYARARRLWGKAVRARAEDWGSMVRENGLPTAKLPVLFRFLFEDLGGWRRFLRDFPKLNRGVVNRTLDIYVRHFLAQMGERCTWVFSLALMNCLRDKKVEGEEAATLLGSYLRMQRATIAERLVDAELIGRGLPPEEYLPIAERRLDKWVASNHMVVDSELVGRTAAWPLLSAPEVWAEQAMISDAIWKVSLERLRTYAAMRAGAPPEGDAFFIAADFHAKTRNLWGKAVGAKKKDFFTASYHGVPWKKVPRLLEVIFGDAQGWRDFEIWLPAIHEGRMNMHIRSDLLKMSTQLGFRAPRPFVKALSMALDDGKFEAGEAAPVFAAYVQMQLDEVIERERGK